MTDEPDYRHPAIFRTRLIAAGVRNFARRYYANKRGVAGLVLLGLLAFAAIFASLLSATAPSAVTAASLRAPSLAHLMGTDNIGRDVFSLVLYGTRSSLATGILAAIFALLIGVVVGSIAGYFRGPTEWLLMRVVDLFQMFPAIVLAIFVAALFGSSFWLVVLVIGIVIWPLEARIVYGQVVVLRDQNFIQAARVAGIARRRIVLGEVLPNALPPVIVQVALDAGLAILIQAALGFLGLGNANDPNWGALLNIAQDYLQNAWWMSVFPGAGIFLAVMAFSLIGDALNEIYNPVARRTRRLSSSRYLRRSQYTRWGKAASTGQSARTRTNEGPERLELQSGRLLEARDITVSFRVGGRLVRAVDSVDMYVNAGECVGLVGESGSGKSMLARALIQLRPSVDLEEFSGEVWFRGVDIAALPESKLRELRHRRSLSMVFQDPLKYLNPTKRIGVQIAEALPETLPRALRAERVDELLAQAGLRRGANLARRYPHELSGGMRQRVLIALALASEPALLIADEPTTGLDVTVQKQLLNTLGRLHRESGMSMLVVSHDLGLIAELCDRVYVMYAGQIVESADVNALFGTPTHPYSRGLLESVPKLDSTELPMVMRGGVPDLSDLPAGCRFQPRCEFVDDKCKEAQVLRRAINSVEVRCWRAESIGETIRRRELFTDGGR